MKKCMKLTAVGLIALGIFACSGAGTDSSSSSSSGTSTPSSSSSSGVPVGSQKSGKELYEEQCALCHGVDGMVGGKFDMHVDDFSLEELYSEILLTMPKDNADKCGQDCSNKVANYIKDVLYIDSKPTETAKVGKSATRLLTRTQLANVIKDTFRPVGVSAADFKEVLPSPLYQGEVGYVNNVDAVASDTYLESVLDVSEGVAEKIADNYFKLVNCGHPTKAINAGGAAYTSVGGVIYEADAHTNGGDGTYTTMDPISGTEDDVIYQSERYGLDLLYNVPVENGTYDVVLNLSEIFFDQSDARVFDVKIEGQVVQAQIDIFSQVGADTATDLVFENISVKDKNITIQFNVEKAHAKINGLVIYRSGQVAEKVLSDQECADKFINIYASKAFRRPIASGEKNDLMNLYKAGADFNEGLILVVQGIIASPFTVYMAENDPGNAEKELSGSELAARLSLLLWDTIPDQALLDDVEGLTEPGVLRSHVERMLQSNKATAGLRSFFQQWLKMSDIPSKPAVGLSKQAANEAADSLARFFDYLVRGSDGTFAQLFTERTAFITPAVAQLYSVEIPAEANSYRGGSEVQLPADNRAGVLTRAGFLAAHSHETFTSPTRRGNALRERILCQHIPLPTDADVADIAKAEGLTGKDFVAVHNEEKACAICHVYLDELGLILENYDTNGVYRTQYGDGSMVDPSGEYLSLSPKDMDQQRKISDALDLSNLISESEVAAECFADNWMRYALARTLEPDQESLHQVVERFKQSGYDLTELLIAIVESKAFTFKGPELGAGE